MENITTDATDNQSLIRGLKEAEKQLDNCPQCAGHSGGLLCPLCEICLGVLIKTRIILAL